MKPTTIYLIAYNVLSALGWLYILCVSIFYMLAFRSFSSSVDKSNAIIKGYYDNNGVIISVVQTAAVLEIVHSAIGLVSSPFLTTLIQVGSRLLVLHGFTNQAPSSHYNPSIFLMIISWALVEVPRYTFYALNLVPSTSGSNLPYPIFWLRYSLFMILYPTGISGEILQIISSHSYYNEKGLQIIVRLSHIILSLYVPFSPFMIWNMWINRKRSFKKRSEEIKAKKDGSASSSAAATSGLVWPITDRETGERSTTIINKNAWASSAKAVSETVATKVDKERNWRHGYAKHVLSHVKESCVSYQNAIKMAEAGLNYLHNTFEFSSAATGNKPVPFAEAMADLTRPNQTPFFTGFIKGDLKSNPNPKLTIPYKKQGLSGERLQAQLKKWVENGTIEQSAAQALLECQENESKWLDLSSKYFVLLGAGSAMGPYEELLQMGANIIAVDIDRPNVWERLIKLARNSPGSITFPLKKQQSECADDQDLYKNAGANLLTQTPEIAVWLRDDAAKGKSVTVGNYTYLDGALHVQLSLACDAIMKVLCDANKNTSIAFLCTPTDDHVIPKEAVDHAKRNLKQAPWWQGLLCKIGLLKSNSSIPPIANLNIVDGIVIPQGPNYALAKRIQHWRCVVARNNGHVVSSNIAPSTNTVSVTSNPLFAAGYAGWKHFSALEVMEPETSKAAMCGIMVFDLCSNKGPANPETKLENPLELFTHGSFHGGVWRAAFTLESIGPVSSSSLAIFNSPGSLYG